MIRLLFLKWEGHVAVDIVARFSQRRRGAAEHADAVRQPAPPARARDPIQDHQRGVSSLHHVPAEGSCSLAK